jgi:flagellar hook-associated protein 1 FlgK
MRSTFSGLEIGRKGLQTQQKALDVTGHNIANANTEGYTRQRAVMQATQPFAYPSFSRLYGAGQLGTGVEIQEIKRIRDDFIDAQVRKENGVAGEWESRKNTLDKLEVVLNEPSDTGLRTVLDQFWESLQTLSTRPEDGSVRAAVRQRGMAVAETFNHLDKQLDDLQKNIDIAVRIKVEEINNIATQIGSLNEQIVKVEVSGDHANDLRDKRDLLIDQLGLLINTDNREDPYGAVTVTIGGRALVSDQQVNYLQTVTVPPNGFAEIQWAVDSSLVTVSSGAIQGLQYSRDVIVDSQRVQLNTLASQFIVSFNTQHQLGFGLDSIDGRDFFTGADASDMAVDAGIIASLDAIAAAAGPAAPLISPGDNGNMLLLAALKHDNTTMGTSTFDDYYRAMAAELGVAGQAANRMVENQDLLLSQLDNQKQQISGVSLDEEMTNMIKFQHAYNAAARVVTSMDELLDVIINRMGI